MATQATVSLVGNIFFATLGDGRRVKQPDLRRLAYALYSSGVLSADIRFEWRAGLRMTTAGQRVGLTAEMTRLERESLNLTVAA
ncbi:MAG: hypothetical protein WBJ68_01995 [Candidatus Dechloromonas phosphoritropha]|nr:hypothetical protein [Candidatus Dechloromonas phosphoritropha]MBP8786187.1 hypothetical protein [Azonexus sp.]MBP9226633.1 hypothetical protein [Azonexus sp.]